MRLILLLPLILLYSCSNSQSSPKDSARLIGRCEGCEAILEYNLPLSPVDTLADWNEKGPRLLLTGTVYEQDGKTPAEDVIIYIYHTDQTGVYPTKGDEKGWDRRHGFLRGWIRTGEDGTYSFYTLRPATYPSRTEPAHVHPILLEPNGKYYWVKATFFHDDPLLTEKDRNVVNPRAGSQSVVTLSTRNGILVAERDFILGKNIPGYENEE